MKSNLRKMVRILILESTGIPDKKMIFLAGLPGAGKSTLLENLGIANLFTNCNIDNFFEPVLMDTFGTMNLHQMKEDFFALDVKIKQLQENGTPVPPKLLEEYLEAKRLVKLEWPTFMTAINQFKDQVGEVCQSGSNFLIDGTASNYRSISKEVDKFRSMGYDCAMIFVDIDTETSMERNLARGAKGKRAIHNSIIKRQGKTMSENIQPYRELFGQNRFFLVPNKGSFEEFIQNIQAIKAGVDAFMES